MLSLTYLAVFLSMPDTLALSPRGAQGLRAVAEYCIAEECAVGGAVSASLVEGTRRGVMQYAGSFAYCSCSRAVMGSLALAGAPLTAYWCKRMRSSLGATFSTQAHHRGTSQHKPQKHHPHSLISKTNRISISSNQLPYHSYLLALLIYCHHPQPQNSILPTCHPPHRHSPSSQASMPLPLIMLTENTNAREKLSCLFSSASSRLVDLVTGENKVNSFSETARKANK